MRFFLLLIAGLILCVWPQVGFTMDRAKEAFGKSPVAELARAAEAGDVAFVKKLVAQGVDVKEVGQEGMTLTHFALLAHKNKPEIMEEVLMAGADPISLLISGDSVPLYAVTRNDADPEVVAVLLKHGISPNWRAETGPYKDKSLLTAAVYGRNLPVIRLLVKEGADINYISPIGGSALHAALDGTDFFMAAFLVESGIDLGLLNNTSKKIKNSNVKSRTAIERFCELEGGKRGANPLPELAEGWKIFTAALAKRGVTMPCGL